MENLDGVSLEVPDFFTEEDTAEALGFLEKTIGSPVRDSGLRRSLSSQDAHQAIQMALWIAGNTGMNVLGSAIWDGIKNFYSYMRGRHPGRPISIEILVRSDDGRRVEYQLGYGSDDALKAIREDVNRNIYGARVEYDRRAPMEFSCTEEDRYFIASLVWRAITFRLKDRGAPHFTYRDEDVVVMEQRQAALGRYLLGAAAYPEDVEQHLFFSDPMAHGPYLGMNAYLTAANDVQIVGTEDRLYCYATLCGIVVICPLRLPEEAQSQWRSDTLLMPASGIRAGDQTIWDGVFGGILAHAAKVVHQKKAEMTDRQREKVRKSMAAVNVEKSPAPRMVALYLLTSPTKRASTLVKAPLRLP